MSTHAERRTLTALLAISGLSHLADPNNVRSVAHALTKGQSENPGGIVTSKIHIDQEGTKINSFLPLRSRLSTAQWTRLAGASELASAILILAPNPTCRRLGSFTAAALQVLLAATNLETIRQELDHPWPTQIPWIARTLTHIPVAKMALSIAKRP